MPTPDNVPTADWLFIEVEKARPQALRFLLTGLATSAEERLEYPDLFDYAEASRPFDEALDAADLSHDHTTTLENACREALCDAFDQGFVLGIAVGQLLSPGAFTMGRDPGAMSPGGMRNDRGTT